ncbi:UNVERIFIED_CONTAM: hypothetical protein Slati_0785800 [Sesamum latifolium]|uniref:VOC domain-containing protein n=1 Tax=Sesamum latifolium TaxID=2727402 RepID=A0AAW2XQC5_9LAMI
MRSRPSSAGAENAIMNNNNNNLINGGRELPMLLSLNHVSFLCKSVKKSVHFYQQLLGPSCPKAMIDKVVCVIKVVQPWGGNPSAGSRKIGKEKKKRRINPKDNHISFQCSDMDVIMKKLEGMGVEYVKGVVREGGIVVDQIFFHDPDGYMIEICNCQNLPLLPLSSSYCSLPKNTLTTSSSFYGNMHCSGEVEALMMENLALDMMNISI